MPNWKKVVVSGSDASLNSLNVTTSVTASSADITNDIQSSLYLNRQILTADQTVPATYNGMLASPISVSQSINLIIETDSTLVIL
jgi:hypothetical protein